MNRGYILLTIITLTAATAAVMYFFYMNIDDGKNDNMGTETNISIDEPNATPETGDILREKEYVNDETVFMRDEVGNSDSIEANESEEAETENETVVEEEVITETIENEPEVAYEPSKEIEPPTTAEDITHAVANSTQGNSWVPKTKSECEMLIGASPFFMDDDVVVVRREKMYRDDGNTETADLLREISCHPQAVWLTWTDASSMRARVEQVRDRAQIVNKIPVFVIYNSPDFTSTKWWVGNQGEDYLNWIKEVAKGLGNSEGWFIVEPDALGLSTDYSELDLEHRLNELSNTVSLLKQHAPNSRVYLDAGHSKWKTPEIFADLLTRANLEEADGFVLNISNYQNLSDEIERGEAISKLTGNKHFIIDTSRNGVGAPADNEWCNASDRALGVPPTIETGNPLIDAFLWVKPPGESDGTCNGGPTPGQFWVEYAIALVKNALDIK